MLGWKKLQTAGCSWRDSLSLQHGCLLSTCTVSGCTKMPLLRLAVNIVFLSFWKLFSSEAKEKKIFWREKFLRKLTRSVSLQRSSITKHFSICHNGISLTNKQTNYFNNEKIKNLKCTMFFLYFIHRSIYRGWLHKQLSPIFLISDIIKQRCVCLQPLNSHVCLK